MIAIKTLCGSLVEQDKSCIHQLFDVVFFFFAVLVFYVPVNIFQSCQEEVFMGGTSTKLRIRNLALGQR